MTHKDIAPLIAKFIRPEQFLLLRRFFYMADLEIYEIDSAYIEYLSNFEEHLFKNKKITQNFSRKYIGIILEINGFMYFAPLSSFKPKHKRLCETIDFIKVGIYAVINLNNMFPAPLNLCKAIKIEKIKNEHYRNLVRAEYRIIKQKTEQIINNAKDVYNHKMINDGKSKLSQRCNDFRNLEIKCKEYKIPSKK
ncbi:type III toxin-antitoxin system ToxN/AbiQ family toxin [bacterium]|nr:type III toxin-antitoxin system ToxN/AbiQ family toxin [bacterium]